MLALVVIWSRKIAWGQKRASRQKRTDHHLPILTMMWTHNKWPYFITDLHNIPLLASFMPPDNKLYSKTWCDAIEKVKNDARWPLCTMKKLQNWRFWSENYSYFEQSHILDPLHCHPFLTQFWPIFEPFRHSSPLENR